LGIGINPKVLYGGWSNNLKRFIYFFLTQEICEQAGANTTHLGKRYAVIYSQRFMNLSWQQKIVGIYVSTQLDLLRSNFLKLLRLYPKHILLKTKLLWAGEPVSTFSNYYFVSGW
jgi:hypothetical protein